VRVCLLHAVFDFKNNKLLAVNICVLLSTETLCSVQVVESEV